MRSLADEVPFDIPDSWEWVRMKYICQLIDGEKIQNASYHNLDARYMRGKAEPQTLNSGKYVSQGTYLILVDGENSGEVFIAPEDGYMGSTFKVLWITTQLFAPYVLKFIELYKEPLRNAKRGAAIPHLNKELFFNLPIPMPPIEEQRRIVEKIDEVSSAVSAYDIAYRKTESLNTAFPEALKKSILQEAVQGKLVPQDPSDEPAEALLERIRAEKQRLIKEGKIKKDKHESVIFRRDNSHYEKLDGVERCIDDELPFEIPENWHWCKIGTIFTLQAGKNIQAAEIHENPFADCYPCYGGNGIRGYVTSPNRTGDYPIIGRQGALCGNVNRATGEFYATEHAVCVETYSQISVAWACLFLTALNLNQYATATAQPGLAVANINEVYIPLPPLAEQHRIVQRIEELLPLVKGL